MIKNENFCDLDMKLNNKFMCLKKQIFTIDNYLLIPIREIDIQNIRKWRNDQLDVLRQENPITKNEQIQYYNNVIKKSFSEKMPDMILFSFMLDNLCVGYGGLVHINWDSKIAEVSFIVDTIRSKNENIYEKDFSIFLKLIKMVSFHELNFKKIFTETYDIRKKHIEILENSGFNLEYKSLKQKKIHNKLVDVLIHSCILDSSHKRFQLL